MNGSLAGPPLAVRSSRAYPGGIMGPSESWEEAIPPSPSRSAPRGHNSNTRIARSQRPHSTLRCRCTARLTFLSASGPEDIDRRKELAWRPFSSRSAPSGRRQAMSMRLPG